MEHWNGDNGELGMVYGTNEKFTPFKSCNSRTITLAMCLIHTCPQSLYFLSRKFMEKYSYNVIKFTILQHSNVRTRPPYCIACVAFNRFSITIIELAQ